MVCVLVEVKANIVSWQIICKIEKERFENDLKRNSMKVSCNVQGVNVVN